MRIPGEVDIDFVLRLDKRQSTTGSSALDAEDRAERRLAQSSYDLLSQPAESLRHSDGRGRLALARRCRGYPRNDNDLAALAIGSFGAKRDLCLVMSLWNK